jgi:NADH-quinone oxidoreductase subunit C
MRGQSAEKNRELIKKLQEKFPGKILGVEDIRNMVVVTTQKDNLLEIMKTLRDDSDFLFDVLIDLTAVDFLGQKDKRFEMIYILLSSSTLSRIRIKIALSENENPPSLINIWKGANWPEREVFDLMGITFDGHSLMQRLIMPDGYLGHPLRKDFPLKGIGEDYLIESILRPVKDELAKEGR